MRCKIVAVPVFFVALLTLGTAASAQTTFSTTLQVSTVAIPQSQVSTLGTPWGFRPIFPIPVWFETRTQPFSIGNEMTVDRVFACDIRIRPATSCMLLGWHPTGFVFGPRPDLSRAFAFAGDGRGRVIASTERDVIFSNDRGRTWQTASYNGTIRPRVMSIDTVTRFGIAAAEGSIHVTDDGGASWRFLIELPQRDITRVVIAGSNAVLADYNGGMWAVVHGSEMVTLSNGGTLSLLHGAPQFVVHNGAITASDDEGRTVHIAPNGTVERTGPTEFFGSR
jgi:hypothetical protein